MMLLIHEKTVNFCLFLCHLNLILEFLRNFLLKSLETSSFLGKNCMKIQRTVAKSDGSEADGSKGSVYIHLDFLFIYSPGKNSLGLDSSRLKGG